MPRVVVIVVLALALGGCGWVHFGQDAVEDDGGPAADGDADADADADADSDGDGDSDADGDADSDADADGDGDADADADSDADADADADGDGDADRATCDTPEACAELARAVFDAINARRAGDPHPWDDRVARACVAHAEHMAETGALSQDGLGDRLDAEGVAWLDVGGSLARIDASVDAEVDDFFADDEDDWIGDPRPTGVGVAPDADGYAFVAAIIIYDEQ